MQPKRCGAFETMRATFCRLSYAISAILPLNARSRRVVERFGVRADDQMEVVGLTWDRYVWPLATGGVARLKPPSTK